MEFDQQAIIDQMIHYLETVLEKPHPVFGGLSICPFSKKARLQNKILYKVIDLSINPLDSTSDLLQAIKLFHEVCSHDVLLVISPNEQALTVERVQAIVDQVNSVIAPMGLTSFGGHPQDTFNIQGVHTRQEPFINLTIQSKAVLQLASEQLARTSYYQHWSAENLSQVGFHDRSEAPADR